MAVLMNKILSFKDSKRNTFTEVPAGKWNADAIFRCLKTETMTGYSDTIFGTNDTLTREQGAVIRAKAFNVEKSSRWASVG